MRQFMIFLCLFFVSYSIVLGGTRHPHTPDSRHLEYGKKFKCVAKLAGTYKDKKYYEASSVIIRPKVILTAAHVVSNSQECYVVLNDNRIYLNKIIIPKDFKEHAFGLNDIAIGFTSEDMKQDFYPELYTDRDEVGKVVSVAGFGVYGTFDTGATDVDVQRRAGSNVVDYIDQGLLICKPDDQNRTSLEFLIASGDSGGGLFIAKKIAGINSCVMASDKITNSSYTDESGHTRVSDHAEWIEKIIALETEGLDKELPSATIVLNTLQSK